jgi:hypothetical protein
MLIAIALPVLLGVTALAIDMGYFFDYKQRMGAAADAAAVAGAFEVKRDPGISPENLRTYVKDDAKRNGFDVDADGTITLTINRPPSMPEGLHIGDPKYVEVLISKPMTTFFAGIIGRTSVTVNARAVAGPDEGTGCLYALNTTAAPYPYVFDVPKSGTSIKVPNCSIISNGSIRVVTATGDSVKAQEFAVTPSSGLISGTGFVTAPTYNVPASSDPFGDMNQAALFGTSWACGWTGQKIKSGVTTNISGNANFLNGVPAGDKDASYVLNPGVYCGNGELEAITITLTNNPAFKVFFNPGLYIVNGGGLDWKHSHVEGYGVTFYLTASAGHAYKSCGGKIMTTDPPDDFLLSAPTSGRYEGLLIIQDRTQGTTSGTPNADCTSDPIEANILPENMTLDGAIYFPNHHLIYGATTTATGNYTILIGGTLEFKGNATLNSNFTGLSSGSPVKRPGLGE